MDGIIFITIRVTFYYYKMTFNFFYFKIMTAMECYYSFYGIILKNRFYLLPKNNKIYLKTIYRSRALTLKTHLK